MKITNYGIIFVTILLPFVFIANMKVDAQKATQRLEVRYNNAIDTAVRDAARALTFNANSNKEIQYESGKNIKVNVDEAIKSFWHTVDINLNPSKDKLSLDVIAQYVPAIVIVGYDGYYVYTFDSYKDGSNQLVKNHMLMPKKPYAFKDANNNSYSFTLDDFVTVYNMNTKMWHTGTRSEVAAACPDIDLLQDKYLFDNVRRTTIINQIQSDLEYYLNIYNEQRLRLGLSYTFTLPLLSQEDWVNTINDVGVFAFIQGLPLGNTTYNHYALGGSRLMNNKVIKAGIDRASGIKYYFNESCPDWRNSDYEIIETYRSRKEAAEDGYHFKKCSIN